MATLTQPSTLGELRDSGYTARSIREEMRDNLVARMREGGLLFPGIQGYEETVIPALQNAILAGQDMILLGERGQAKSRIIRSLASLLARLPAPATHGRHRVGSPAAGSRPCWRRRAR